MTRTRPIPRTAIGRSSSTARGVRWAARSVPSSASPRVPASAPRAQSAEADTGPIRVEPTSMLTWGVSCGGGNFGVLLLQRQRRLRVLPTWHLLALRRDGHARGQLSPRPLRSAATCCPRAGAGRPIRSPGRHLTTPASAGARCSSTARRWPPAPPTATPRARYRARTSRRRRSRSVRSRTGATRSSSSPPTRRATRPPWRRPSMSTATARPRRSPERAARRSRSLSPTARRAWRAARSWCATRRANRSARCRRRSPTAR